MKVLIDASSLIALTKTGSLDLIKDVFGRVFITKEIEKEITSGTLADVAILKGKIKDWIEVIESPSSKEYYTKLKGLDEGECSILGYAKENKDVLLILDEVEGRAVAEAEGFTHTGTLGLIVYACEKRIISKSRAMGIIKKLSRSEFRMTTELYDWALTKIEAVKK
ncbi:MAG: hypothetical protein QMC78_03095 [Methanocellales archaeon]|nr:hypothetical protein [Methanocellales archaeon]